MMIRDDNLKHWMESLGKQRKQTHQHMQFSKHLNEALSLVKGESPTIFTPINECFDASLRLFVEELGLQDGGEGDPVQEFAQGETYRTNTGTSRRPQRYSKHPDDTDELRARARKFFRDDFAFYDVVVEQFKRNMEASVKRSGGDERYYDSCKYYNKTMR